MKNNKLSVYLINISLGLLIMILLNMVSGYFEPITTVLKLLSVPIILSLFLYYALRPIVRRLNNKKLNKGTIALLTIVLFLLFLIVMIGYGFTVIKDQFQNSFIINLDQLLNYTNIIDSGLGGYISEFDLTSDLLNAFKNMILNASSHMASFFSETGNILTQIILIPFMLFYLLKEEGKIKEGILIYVPSRYRVTIDNMLSKLDDVLSTYISGQLLVALIIGILMSIAYILIGLPDALLMGFFSMITAIIPLIGPFLGIIPALFIGLSISGFMILKIVIAALIVQQIEGNLITPNIIGSKLKIHPLSVILIVIISVHLLGLTGAFIGIPFYLVTKIIFRTVYEAYFNKNHESHI